MNATLYSYTLTAALAALVCGWLTVRHYRLRMKQEHRRATAKLRAAAGICPACGLARRRSV